MLPRGSRIAVVAPSGIPDAVKLAVGVEALRAWGYVVEVLPGVRAEHRYFAGNDDIRVVDLHCAFSGQFDAVWLARGGSGLARIVGKLDWSRISRVPCFGFSDGTTLLNALASRGFPAIHAPVLNALGLHNDDQTRQALRLLLAGVGEVRLAGTWLVGSGGDIEAPVAGGNLCVLASLAGTALQLDARGKIVLLEDLGEVPYKLDRLLVQGRDSGSFAGAVAFVLGDFIGAEPPPGATWTVPDLVLDVLGPLGVPILHNLPVGHGPRNEPVPLGTLARFHGTELVVRTNNRERRQRLSVAPLRQCLVEATGVVAPSVSGCVWVQGREVFAYEADRTYDLASLTKILCTTELVLRLVEQGKLTMDGGHALWPPGVTTRLLLQHASGFLWWKELWHAGSRDEIVKAALAEGLVCPPGTVHTYSDLGFLALGAAVEAEMGQPLDVGWMSVAPGIAARFAWGHPAAEPTGEGPTGIVNDQNARGMGGKAPHAGLFGTARAVAAAAQRWLDGQVPLADAAFRTLGIGSHALGWDTPSGDASSAGLRPPLDAVGHTGFTGTSVWMSPSQGVISVLLTNRVAFGRDPVRIRALRSRWHQLAWDQAAG